MSLKFDSVLIITYGRSGSTLLQGLINSIDGVVVRGENENFIYGLYEAYKRLKQAKKQKKSLYPSDSWYGSHLIDMELFIKQCSNIIRNIILADLKHDNKIHTYGFKEIRYHLIKDFDDYLDFLYQVFPQACFIFNTRNKEDVCNSSWWKSQEKASVLKLLTDMESKFDQYAKRNPDHCFQITYEDLVNQTSKLKSMFEFLGATYVDEDVNKILNTPHSDPTQVLIDQVVIESGIKVTYFVSIYGKLIKFFIMDRFSKQASTDNRLSFQGVIIPLSDSISVNSFKVITSNGETQGIIGLDSPLYGRKYHKILSASKARFKVDNILISDQENAKIMIEIAVSGKVETLKFATIEINS